jgi:hypothetical protein
MNSSPVETHSQLMASLHDWVRSTAPENYDDDLNPFGSGTAVSLAIYHKHLVNVVNNKAVVWALREICANMPADHGLVYLLETIKDIIACAVIGRGMADQYRNSDTTAKQLLKDLDTAKRHVKVLWPQLKTLEGRIPKAAFGIEHLSKRLAADDLTDAGMYSITGWGSAIKKHKSDVQISDLLKMLVFEISNQADRVRQSVTTSGSRQTNSKKKVQRREAIALLKLADQRLDFSSTKRLKPRHNFVHALLTCLWGELAVERSYISKLSTELKTRANKV